MAGLFGSITVKGNRLTEFATQTASVGIPIPFGYGHFPCEGNIGFAPMPPKEHVKKKKQGKGGVKTEEYSYTLSYAIMFCEGPIFGYLTIKRNGKVVWTQDPNATVDDRAYAAKWAQKATFYYGTETQLPDSTIESYKGAGNVSAFRGIAYIVVEDDDVTDNGGAVPTYEAVVMATPPEAYLTSHVYAQYLDDSLKIEPLFLSAGVRQIMIEWPQPAESLSVEPNFIAAATRPIQWAFNQYPEMLSVAPNFISAATKLVQVTYNHPAEDLLIATPNFIGASTKQVLYQNVIPAESLSITPNFIGASTA